MFTDIVFPKNNEAEFISIAKKLGYSKLCFIYNDLEKIKKTSIGKDARIIAEVKESNPKLVIMRTPLGSKRIIEKPMGELIPRIC